MHSLTCNLYFWGLSYISPFFLYYLNLICYNDKKICCNFRLISMCKGMHLYASLLTFFSKEGNPADRMIWNSNVAGILKLLILFRKGDTPSSHNCEITVFAGSHKYARERKPRPRNK